MNTRDLFTISELAHRSGFAPSAIRFYEGQGLLTALGRPAVSADSNARCCGAWHSSGPPETSD